MIARASSFHANSTLEAREWWDAPHKRRVMMIFAAGSTTPIVSLEEWNELSQSQRARLVRKANKARGLTIVRSLNREQDVREKAAADLRRQALAAPGSDRAPAMTRAFREARAA